MRKEEVTGDTIGNSEKYKKLTNLIAILNG